jgi:hypothetical protein
LHPAARPHFPEDDQYRSGFMDFFGNHQRYFIASLFVTLCETCDLLASLFLC